jgi:hypothetical protein
MIDDARTPSPAQSSRAGTSVNFSIYLTMVKVNRFGSPRSRNKPHVVLNVTKIVSGLTCLICIILLIHFTTTTKRPTSSDGSLLRTSTDAAAPATNQKNGIATIAFAVSVTGCGSDPITEGAAVLKHSIHRASVHGSLGGRYDYEMFAIYHPQAQECAEPLEKLGWKLLKREVFVKVSDIKGDYLREKIEKNGCCGEKELIKLEAYTLTDYPIVVHLDLDVLILKPMDDVFDMMLATTPINADDNKYSDIIMYYPQQTIPSQINALFTYDYNMVGPHVEYKPVQGGLIILRPDLKVYEEFRQIVLQGDFRSGGAQGSGWGGKVGPFHGSMTFQGIVPYYYNFLHQGQSLVLNRCVYNQMCDNPRDKPTKNDIVSGACRTGETDCEDCRSRPLEDVVTTHFTLCQKPWWCLPHTEDAIQHRLCQKLTREWYRIRSEMEKSWGRSGQGPGDYHTDIFFGYCEHNGGKGYTYIGEPYGSVRATS